MPAVVKTILQNNTVHWNWPVLVGLPLQSAFKPQVLTRLHWAKELSRISVIKHSGVPLRYNMLLCNGPAEATELIKKALPGKIAIRTDVLLIKCDPSVFRSGQPAAGIELVARMLANSLGASGIIFFHTTLPDEQWFEMLMIELSHDLPITKAFAQLKSGISWAFVSPELDHFTRLSTLVAQISEGLIKGQYTLTKPVRYIRPNNAVITIGNAAQLGRLMKEDFPKMDYSGESKTGTTMLGVAPGVKATRPLPSKPLQKNTVDLAKRKFPLKGSSDMDMFRKLMKDTEIGKNILINNPVNIPGKKKFDFTSADADSGGRGFNPIIKKESKTHSSDKKSAKPPVKIGGIESFPAEKKKAARPSHSAVKKNGGSKKNGGGSHQPEAEVIVSRYLQANLNKKGEEKTVTDFLLPKTTYTLNVFIGEKDPDFISSDIAVDTGEIFKDTKVKKAVIELQVHCNTLKKPLIGKITLPRFGDSNMAAFAISTGQKEKVLEAAIYAYYKGGLLQKKILSIDIRKPDEKPVLKKLVMKDEAVLDKDMSGLGNKKPVKASIAEPADSGISNLAAGHLNNKPLGLKFNTSVKDIAGKIRAFIEETVTDINQSNKPLTDKVNVRLLRRLASQGSLLFRNQIKEEINGLIQIVSVREEYTPFEFIYTKPAPYPEAGLCKNAVEALKAGKCRNCKAPGNDAQGHICPFGFWGISNVIERHKYSIKKDNPDNSDYILETNASTNREIKPVLNRTQFAESKRMENGNHGLIKEVDTAISKNSANAFKADDWKSWKKSVLNNDPDCYFLVVHMQEDTETGTDAMEIGDKKLLPISLIDAGLIKKDKSSNKMPLVVLIGCETSNLNSYAFGAPDLLIQTGSAIVLSNFTRIRGKHAGRIVIRLVELLKKYAAKPIEFGVIIRKLKQELLAEGNMVSLTLLAHGDADWKISTKP